MIEGVTFRLMKAGEEAILVKLAKRAFSGIESWIVASPHDAMVADLNGQVIGAVMFQTIQIEDKKVAYMEHAFVNKEFCGQGVGKKLYRSTVNHLKGLDCDFFTALIKGDNVGSWKPFVDQGFVRTKARDLVAYFGFKGFIDLSLKIPYHIAIGMDLYTIDRQTLTCYQEEVSQLQDKGDGLGQGPKAHQTRHMTPRANNRGQLSNIIPWLTYFGLNFLVTLPIWVYLGLSQGQHLPWSLLAYAILMVIIGVSRFLSRQINSTLDADGAFRLNGGGSLVALLLACLGLAYPMEGNWYPVTYQKSASFLKMLALPELIKWGILLMSFGIVRWGLVPSPLTQAYVKWTSMYLVYQCIPLYPFDTLGGSRVKKWSPRTWLVSVLVTILVLALSLLT
ncbi:TPA: GNAT family N-acetyltransferase [Streptococcus suis]